MRLQYEIATTGQGQIRTVLRGIEREAAASDKRLETQRRNSARASTREATAGPRGAGMDQARRLREQAAANRQRSRETLQSVKAEERARLTADKNTARARDSLDKQRSRALFSQYKSEEAAARRLVAARQSTAERVGRGAARSVSNGIGNTMKIGGAALAVAGGFAAADALREESDIRRRAAVLANQAGNPALKGELASESRNVRGFTGSETLGAMSSFVGKTGDLDAARATMKDLGELALVTDTNFETLGETAGNAFNVIADAIQDPKKRIEALKKVMAGWAGQGNVGAVELTDLAQFGGRLGGATRKFAGDPAELLLSMGAMSQAAVRGGGASDAAEATTGVARFASDLTKKPAQKALAAMGVNVFADKGKTKLRDPAEIVADILEKTKGSLPQSEEIMNAESGKVLGGFSSIFTDAEAKKKGSGRGAVLGEFKRYKDAGLTSGAITKGADSVMEEPDKQFSEAMKAFNHAMGSELLPAVTKLIPQFTEMVPHVASATGELAKFVGWFSQNPLSGIGLIVGASVAKDIAGAAIGKGLSVALNAAISGGGSLLGKLPAGALGAAGAGAAAVGGVALAVDQANSFGKENGGWGGAASFLGFGEGDGWGFDGVDSYMNKQAKAEAAKRPKLKPPGMDVAGTTAPAAAGSTTPATKNGAAAAGEASPAAAQQSAAATEQQKAAIDLKDAAAALKAAAGRQPPGGEASRNAPIISPSRG